MTVRTSAIAAALTLCTASLHAAEIKNIDRTLPLSANGAVTLDIHNGSVQVRTWDRAEVEVHVRIEARGTSEAARRRVLATTVNIDGSPNLVSIASNPFDHWGLSLWFLSWEDTTPQITYAISAPRTARWRISNHNAKVELRDVNAAVDISTHNGSVWVANLNGPINVTMHNGDAHIDFASFTQASSVSSHNGSAELILPAASRFQVQSQGHRMQMDSAFPLAMRASDFGRHNVDGQVNGGGPNLRLTSHNGSFRLQSK
jgi:hypothetical protein